MVKQRPLDSHSPAPNTDAVRLTLVTDAELLHDDLDVPLQRAVRVVVHDSDHVAPEDRETTVAAVLDHLD